MHYQDYGPQIHVAFFYLTKRFGSVCCLQY
jgi:hypothetical protein